MSYRRPQAGVLRFRSRRVQSELQGAESTNSPNVLSSQTFEKQETDAPPMGISIRERVEDQDSTDRQAN